MGPYFFLQIPGKTVAIARDPGDRILQLHVELGLGCSQFDRIRRQFYQDILLSPATVRAFREDLRALLERYSEIVGTKLLRQRKISARERVARARYWTVS